MCALCASPLITAGYSNPALNQYIVPTTVLEWTRNILANRLANNGSQWTEIYSQFNSGTYNNQNMVRACGDARVHVA